MGKQPASNNRRKTSAADLGPAAQAPSAASASEAAGDTGGDAQTATKGRRQLGRRSSEETIERAIQVKFAHIPAEVLETKQFDGLHIRERVRADRRALGKGGRLGTKYWETLLAQVDEHVEGLGNLRPAEKDHWAFFTPPTQFQIRIDVVVAFSSAGFCV